MGHMFTLFNVIMNAIETIKATYDYETCKEIVDHGCQSGVCSQHIYYGDTIEFFTKYPDEITGYIKDILGVEVLSDTLKQNDGDLDAWMNDLTWTFIELVAMEVVDTKEEQERRDDLIIEGYNPSRSMTESRYAQV